MDVAQPAVRLHFSSSVSAGVQNQRDKRYARLLMQPEEQRPCSRPGPEMNTEDLRKIGVGWEPGTLRDRKQPNSKTKNRKI